MLSKIGASAAGLFLFAACSAGTSSSIPSASNTGAVPMVASSDSRIAIQGPGSDPALDALVVKFMIAQRVPNAQLAFSRAGTLRFSHAYTYRGLAESTTKPQTLMRMASVTKAWTNAAIYNLLKAHKIGWKTKVFSYLGITQALPDGATPAPGVLGITLKQMVDNTPGWTNDPSFTMRQTALALKLHTHIDQQQYVAYQLHVPLTYKPGTHYLYCNFCFDVLGMIVAKATLMPYIEYLRCSIAKPSGAGFIGISPTVGKRLPGEVARYYSTQTGLSAFYPDELKPVPAPYGGDGGVLEVAQGDGGAATSAQSMIAFMNRYTVGDLGPLPLPGESVGREGEIAGTSTVAEQLGNRTNYAFFINTNQFPYKGARNGSATSPSGPPTAFDIVVAKIAHQLCTSC
ncbi:MAG TPA: serine hydrolase domain-containing protein [Verrucomicrobiae bacterium]|nr:serine hydrolase domain-containing protein [Verrucomicrobiae bacterium]